MTLSPWSGTAGMIILWHIRFPLLTLIFISVTFSSRPLGTGIHFQTLLSPLLKVPRMVLLSSLNWSELGTSLPGPGEWLSFWRVTSKQFWFWFHRQSNLLLNAQTVFASTTFDGKQFHESERIFSDIQSGSTFEDFILMTIYLLIIHNPLLIVIWILYMNLLVF